MTLAEIADKIRDILRRLVAVERRTRNLPDREAILKQRPGLEFAILDEAWVYGSGSATASIHTGPPEDKTDTGVNIELFNSMGQLGDALSAGSAVWFQRSGSVGDIIVARCPAS